MPCLNVHGAFCGFVFWVDDQGPGLLFCSNLFLTCKDIACRCVSQMVLARVSNVKSGWKSMFMVFTTAANDESPMIVRLAFDTVEKIVREHFDYITETEVLLVHLTYQMFLNQLSF